MLRKIDILSALVFFACTLTMQAAHHRSVIPKKSPSDLGNKQKDFSRSASIVEEPTCCGLSYTNAKLLARLSFVPGALITAAGVVHYFEGHTALGDESAWQVFCIPFKFLVTPSDDPREREAFLTKTCIRLCMFCPHYATLVGGASTCTCLDYCVDQCFKGPNIAKMED